MGRSALAEMPVNIGRNSLWTERKGSLNGEIITAFFGKIKKSMEIFRNCENIVDFKEKLGYS